MDVGLIKRFGYYFGGFAIGLVLLAFFLNGKKTSCDYFPDARIIKDIGRKVLVYSDESQQQIKRLGLDSTKIKELINRADVNLSKSSQRKKPCGTIILESSLSRKDYELTIEKCSKKSLLVSVESVP